MFRSLSRSFGSWMSKPSKTKTGTTHSGNQSSSNSSRRFGTRGQMAVGAGGAAAVASSVSLFSSSGGKPSLKNELIEVFLNLEQLDTNLFRAHHLISGIKTSQTVYGGQVMGQALMAADATVDDAYWPHSLYCSFIRAGKTGQPILYNVERIRDGKSYVNRTVKAIQDGVAIFTADVSFHKEEADSITHQSIMPKVPPPEELKDTTTLFRELMNNTDYDQTRRDFWKFRLENTPSTFAMKPCDPKAYTCLEPSQPKIACWVKTNELIGFISDISMLTAAILTHMASGFHVGMALTLSHCIWIHRPKFRLDHWMLYETESSIAAGGRAMIHGRLWTRDGVLVMSTAQEGLVRAAKPKL